MLKSWLAIQWPHNSHSGNYYISVSNLIKSWLQLKIDKKIYFDDIKWYISHYCRRSWAALSNGRGLKILELYFSPVSEKYQSVISVWHSETMRNLSTTATEVSLIHETLLKVCCCKTRHARLPVAAGIHWEVRAVAKWLRRCTPRSAIETKVMSLCCREYRQCLFLVVENHWICRGSEVSLHILALLIIVQKVPF